MAGPETPETPKAFDAVTSPAVFPPSDETKDISEELPTDDPTLPGILTFFVFNNDMSRNGPFTFETIYLKTSN